MDKGYAPMNEQKYVTYKDLIIFFTLMVMIWFFQLVIIDRMTEKINTLNMRLTRTEAICYGTGQSQSD